MTGDPTGNSASILDFRILRTLWAEPGIVTRPVLLMKLDLRRDSIKPVNDIVERRLQTLTRLGYITLRNGCSYVLTSKGSDLLTDIEESLKGYLNPRRQT